MDTSPKDVSELLHKIWLLLAVIAVVAVGGAGYVIFKPSYERGQRHAAKERAADASAERYFRSHCKGWESILREGPGIVGADNYAYAQGFVKEHCR